ncbi:phytanoyl-CoA dioxygenase family protein (plasmid) [Tistrella bauzanensis]|uniref:radical SAM protein n=1 Tax=Tistrella TaxID=171436 RepID=UPI0031F6088B
MNAITSQSRPAPFVDSTPLIGDPAALRTRLRTSGYLFLRGVVPRPALDAAARDMTAEAARDGWFIDGTPPAARITNPAAACAEPEPAFRAVYDRVFMRQSFHSVAHEPAMTGLMTGLLDTPDLLVHPRTIGRMIFPARPGHDDFTTPAHQDYWALQGTPDTLTAWIPLHDCPYEHGSLMVAEGTHREGIFPYRLCLGAGGVEVENPLTGRWRGGDFAAGDVLIFYTLTVHRASPNLTNRLRLSIDCRFQPAAEEVNQECLRLSGTPYDWDQIYTGWSRDDLRYYWRRFDLKTVAYDPKYYARRDELAFIEGRKGNRAAISALQRVEKADPDPERRAAATALLARFTAPAATTAQTIPATPSAPARQAVQARQAVPARQGVPDGAICGRHPAMGVNNVALELTEACNYRCTMCDYWRIPNPKFMPLADARDFLGLFGETGLASVLLTGGEPLLHPQWREIAGMLPEGARRSLCTNGSPILKKNRDVATFFDRLTVSVDGATDENFARIRGFRHLEGIMRALEEIKAARPQIRIQIKMTIMRHNFTDTLPIFARCLEGGFVDGVGFGIPDTSLLAFGFEQTARERAAYLDAMFPTADELPRFAAIVDDIHDRFAGAIAAGFMYEGDLRRYLARFMALRGLGPAPAGRACCIPFHSMVLKADGRVSGCYFLSDTTTIDDLRGPDGLLAHMKALDGHSAAASPVCRSCDQLLFPGSPFEAPAGA